LKHTYALDVETTGLRVPKPGIAKPDEIIQLAIVDVNGSALFNEYFRPESNSISSDARHANHISDKMLRSKYLFREHLNAIQRLVSEADLIIMYNAEFDTAFLSYQGIKFTDTPVFCLMKAFSRLQAVRKPSRQSNRRYTLGQCAEYFKVSITGKAHDALTDARTTLSCYIEMLRLTEAKEG